MNNLNKIVIILMASLIVLFAATAPTPPAIPEMQIVSGHEEIKLIWDNQAEYSIDPLTRYSDFEGYRIYRSTDGGKTWGKSWNRIYDYSGNHVAWKPYVQFDLVEESDTNHCIYSNAYYDEPNELCFTNAIPYDSLLSTAPHLLGDIGVIIKGSCIDADVDYGVISKASCGEIPEAVWEESLVYLPDYKRGDCPFDYAHDLTTHNSDNSSAWKGSHFANDCFIGGVLSEFDPMANWISLGDNDGLKRSFVDTDVLDGVQYTYAVTAFDMGLISFNVEYLSTASGNSNDICFIEDYEFFDDDEKALLEIEGFCESLPSCQWSVGDGECQYLDENYCSGNDSYCTGKECCSDEFCCYYDLTPFDGMHDGTVVDSKAECLGTTFGNVYWLPDSLLDESACEDEGFIWGDVNHGFADYSYKELCEDSDHEWVAVEYLDELSCESADYEWKIIEFLPDTTWSSWNPGHFTGLEYGDELWGYPSFESPKLYESFTDYNVNGVCDYNPLSDPPSYEPFTDMDGSDANNNGRCDESGDWTKRCPDILENCKNDTNSDGFIDGDDDNCCINVVVVESGYKASNVTFPDDDDDTPEIGFIVPDANNRGNGDRVYNIVNEYDLPTDPVILRFEINAGLDPDTYGDISGSFATKNPSLFIYEATSFNNYTPKNMKQPYETQNFDSLGIDSLLGLPGAVYESSEISVPDYLVEDFKLLSIDNPLSESNFTEWFNGIQFRFDNGPNKPDNNSSVVLKDIAYSDTLLNDYLNIKLRYISRKDLEARLMYRYKIEFSTSYIDTSILMAPLVSGGNCSNNRIITGCEDFITKISCNNDDDCMWDDEINKCIVNGYRGFMSLLPFKIFNIDTGNQLKIEHRDKGVFQGLITFGEDNEDDDCEGCDGVLEHCINRKCVEKIGYKDCVWGYNEVITLTDTVFTTNNLNGFDEKVFHLKIDFDFADYARSHEPDFFGEVFFTTGWDWISGKAYAISDLVYYEGMLYRSNIAISDDIPPNYWFDNDGDNINDNVWQMLYPWKDGDSVILEPYGWYQDGDAWVADLSIIGELDDNDDDDLENVSVVPNPYIVSSDYFNESPGNHLLRFTRLPTECTISIYTVSGEFVTRLDHDDSFSGNEWWDITNGGGQPIAPGLYIYVIETPGGKSKMGKFAIVR